MADVFISYKSRMRPRVREIASALEALGLSVWFDAELEAGRSFAAVINAELEKASCVIVCWTPDAFAPEDGSEVSWVEAEATLARDRKVIVPVMLERVALRAPWNMFHTERLMDWTPASTDFGPWLALLDVIGRHVGRPGLADYAKAADNPAALLEWARRYPDDPRASLIGNVRPTPAVTARRLVRRATQLPKSTRWLLGATLFNCLAAVLLLLRIGPTAEGPASYVLLAGPVASSAVFAVALWRGGVLDPGRAVFTIAAGIAGYIAAAFTAPLVEPLMSIFGTDHDSVRGFINGFLAGAIGAFIALAGVALLIGRVRRERWLKLLVGSLALGLVCGLLGTGPLFAIYSSNFFWISVIWTLGYGLLLAVLAGRSASSM